MKIIHTFYQSIGVELIVFGLRGTNYKITVYHHRNHKRFSKVSSWRWIECESITISIFRCSTLYYKIHSKEVREETILKILFHYKDYLKSCGIINFEGISDVILD